MLNTAELMCFAATANPDAARAFYRDTLGLELVEESPFALVFNANGIMLRVQNVPELVPAQYTMIGWKVADIRAELAELAARGVVALRYPWMQQDELGIWHTGSGAMVAWFHDPDGNTLSLTQW